MTNLQPLPYQIAEKAPALNAALAALDENAPSIKNEHELLSVLANIHYTINELRKYAGDILAGTTRPEDVDPEHFLQNYNLALVTTNSNFKRAEKLLASDPSLQRFAPVVQATRNVMDILMSMRNLNSIAHFPLHPAASTAGNDDGIVGSIFEGKT